jgi:hypothetical protein
MRALIPAIEIPRDKDILGIRGPYSEIGSFGGVSCHGMGAELFIKTKMAPLIEEVDIIICKSC